HPNRAELDAACPNHPVFLRHISGHSAIVNSRAIAMSGLTDSVTDPRGAHYGRDSSGRLNGLLEELPTMKTVIDVIPKLSSEQILNLLETASQDYVAQGITTCTDAAVGLRSGPEELDAHIEAVNQRKNPMRMRLMIMHHLLQSDGPFGDLSAAELDRIIRERSDNRVCLDSAKLFQDGSIQLLTAALRAPYHCAPDKPGSLMHPQEMLNQTVLDLHRRGFRIAIHGNGDRAIGSILDAYQFALDHDFRQDHRHRVEHAQTASGADLDRMAALGVAASFFINHVYYWGDRHERLFLGVDRARRIDPLADAVERDLLFTIHSDCPITPISPLFSVWAAVNRLTREGQVLGGDQRCDVETALRSMTSMGAALNFEGHVSGAIEPGKRADFAVLDQDPTTVAPSGIKDIAVRGTVIGGDVVYSRDL
ncbi:MAG: amidohydrolase, partial [Bacilli bacterium]